MVASSYSRGHKLIFKNKWIFEDGEEIYERPCVRCGNLPIEGYDSCLGFIEGVKSACCGHGVEEGFIKKEVMMKELKLSTNDKCYSIEDVMSVDLKAIRRLLTLILVGVVVLSVVVVSFEILYFGISLF